MLYAFAMNTLAVSETGTGSPVQNAEVITLNLGEIMGETPTASPSVAAASPAAAPVVLEVVEVVAPVAQAPQPAAAPVAQAPQPAAAPEPVTPQAPVAAGAVTVALEPGRKVPKIPGEPGVAGRLLASAKVGTTRRWSGMPWWAWCKAMVCLLGLVTVLVAWGVPTAIAQGLELSATQSRNTELAHQLKVANDRINNHPWWKFWSW